MKFKTEKSIKEGTKKLLKENNIFFFMPSASVYGRAGVADFICCMNGRFVAIETKSGTNKQTPLQRRFQDAVESAGGMYFLIRTESDVATMMTYFLRS